MFVVDLDPIPLAEPDDRDPIPARPRSSRRRAGRDAAQTQCLPDPGNGSRPAVIVVLCSLHGLAIWWGLGGRAGLTNGWPLWRDDHPLYYHSALVTRSFLKSSWTTAGYDPSFMAGYAKSVVFPSSSTLPELVVAAFGGDHPEFAYKIYVLVSAAAVPWLIALACVFWRIPASRSGDRRLARSALHLDRLSDQLRGFWGCCRTFSPSRVGLAATGAFARFLTRRGVINWLMSAGLMSLAFLIHFTTAMVIVPAAALAYVAAIVRDVEASRRTRRRERVVRHRARPDSSRTEGSRARFHLAVWMIPLVVLAVNAFWWLPGIWLASTKGTSDFAFNHPEGVMQPAGADRNSAGVESPIQSILLGGGPAGIVLGLAAQSI